MRPCLSDSQLFAMVEGRLDAGDRDELEVHVDRCPSCRKMLAALFDSEAAIGGEQPDVEALEPGTEVGRYVVEGVLGTGGMGTVYSARDLELGRTVALKVLFGGTALIGREAEIMAQLSHPNIVPVYSIVSSRFGDFVAMERVGGPTLRRWLEREPRSARAILDVFLGAGEGLAAAHAAGVVHRDFKPDNVLVDGAGRARITDFGLASRASAATTGGGGVHPYTPAGGTPAYAAPEQLSGGAVGPAADQYAFCVSLCEALGGERPQWGGDGRVRLPPSVPARVGRLIRRGLEQDPVRRFASMQSLVALLARFDPRAARTWVGPFVATAAALGVLAVAAPSGHVDPCSTLSSSEVWSPARQRVLIESVDPETRPVAERVAADVAHYVDRWNETRTRACEREASDAVGPAACLRRRLAALDTLLGAFGDAEWTLRVRGLSAVQELETPLSCLGMAEPESQEGLEVLARAEALVRAGRPSEALARLEGAARSGAGASGPLQARYHYALGATYKALGRPSEAAELLEHAYWRAQAEGRPEAGFVAARDLASIAVGAHDFERARRWLRHARTQADRFGTPEYRAADVLVVEGNLHLRRGELDQAHAAYARAGQLRAAAGLEDAATLTIAHNLAIVAGRRSGAEDALALHRANLERRRGVLGPNHPDVGDSLLSIAANLVQQMELGDAIDSFEDALAIYELALGPDAEPVLDTLENLGGTLAMAGRIEEARETLGRVLAAAERTDDALLAGHVSLNLGEIGLMSEQPEGAQRDYRSALRFLETRLDPTDPVIATAVGGIGEAYLQQGQASTAIGYLERALEIRSEHPDDVVMLARVRFVLARALWDSGEDRARALLVAREARDGLPTRKGRTSRVRAAIDAWLREHDDAAGS